MKHEEFQRNRENMSLLKIFYIDDHEKNDCMERPGVWGRGQNKEISENAVRFSALRNTN